MSYEDWKKLNKSHYIILLKDKKKDNSCDCKCIELEDDFIINEYYGDSHIQTMGF